jgi:hypothetical protein
MQFESHIEGQTLLIELVATFATAATPTHSMHV